MKKVIRFCLMVSLCTYVMSSCKNESKNKSATRAHLFESRHPNIRTLYVDTLPVSAVMRVKEDANAKTIFYCYKIGISDSVKRDKQGVTEWNKYIDYEMQHDWKMIANGDSIPVAFFQPGIHKTAGLYEGVLVFEVPDNFKPVSLYYRGHGSLEPEELIDLNSK